LINSFRVRLAIAALLITFGGESQTYLTPPNVIKRAAIANKELIKSLTLIVCYNSVGVTK